MGTPAIGDVVLVPFPFSDLSETKVRPALVLANVGRGDWILCQITSNAYGDPRAIPLLNTDFHAGGLLTASVARPGKLFTANNSLVRRRVGTLHNTHFQRILDAVVDVIRPASQSSA